MTEAFGAMKGKAAASSYALKNGSVAAGLAVGRQRSQRDLLGRDEQGRQVRVHDELRRRCRVAVRDRPDGTLSLEIAVAGIAVEGETGLRDEDISGDGRFLYAIDADSQRILGWAVGSDGLSDADRVVEWAARNGRRPRGELIGMRLEPLYRATFTTPESWSVELAGPRGTEGQSFLIAEGRSTGRLSARLRAANFPRQRVDGTLLPDFRGALDTDDGATILFSWSGYARAARGDVSELVGGIDARHR